MQVSNFVPTVNEAAATYKGLCPGGGGTRCILEWGGVPRIPIFDTLFNTFVERTRRLFIVQEKIPSLRQKLIKSIP